jgi:queuine/archaeosine tRNA-ribosyltransferase
MIDSGGFALMRSPSNKWSARIVANLIDAVQADVFVSLDLPPAAQDNREARVDKIKASMRNFRYLSERLPRKTIMPVVHGRTQSEIDLSIELLLKRETPDWVGLGGIVPLLQGRNPSKEIASTGPEAFIGASVRSIRRAFPSAKIHAFGAGGTRTFPALYAFGVDSADSIGWRHAAGFGSIFLPLKSQRLVAWERDSRPPRRILDESDIAQIESCSCPICRMRPALRARLDALKDGFHNRAIHNAWTLSNQFLHWPKARSEMATMVASGAFGERWAAALQKV